MIPESQGGWPTIAPSAIRFDEKYPVPRELSLEGIRAVVEAFAAAAARARRAGFRVLEIHAAHGYLLHQFLSPLSNRRTDSYGGPFGNRTRLLREVVTAVRKEWPEQFPLFARISATDWVEGGWDVDQSVELACALKPLGVDLIDCSSGGSAPHASIPFGPGYQTPFAERIRRDAQIHTGAVGMITSPAQADQIIRNGQADLVLLAREMLHDPYWPLHAAQALSQTVPWPTQYLRAAPAGTVARK